MYCILLPLRGMSIFAQKIKRTMCVCERISVSGIIVCILTANKFYTLYLFSDSFCDANKYVGLSKDVAKRSTM